MRSLFLTGLALVFFTSIATFARADDPQPGSDEAKKQAEDLMKQASSHWKDPDPTQCRDLALKAHDLDPKSFTCLAFLGSLYDIKYGDADKALSFYDQTIQSLVGQDDPKFKRYKADIMARKGDVLYTYKNDLDAANAAYLASLQCYELSTTYDKLSNLQHRLAGTKTDPAQQKDANTKALKYAKDAITAAAYMTDTPEKHKHWMAKLLLQKWLCEKALGDPAAPDTYGKIVQDDIDTSCQYNLALNQAFDGDGATAAKTLKSYIKETRPTARARNQLRKIIASEPDFGKFVKTDDWADLVTMEHEDDAGSDSGNK